MSQTAKATESVSNGKDLAAAEKRAADAVKQGVEKVQEAASYMQENVHQLTEQAGTEVRNMSNATAKFVKKNPGTAIAGAVGVGILLGMALRGKN